MFGFRKRREAREAAVRLEREKSWWEFMLDMDFLHGKISEAEMRDRRVRIRNGEEYRGWALREKP